MKKLVKPLIGIILGLAVLFTFYLLWKQSQPEPIVYEIITPTKRSLKVETVASGVLETRTKVDLKPKITGIIESIFVEPGQVVNAGDLVAILKVIPDMNQLNQAQSTVESARIHLAEIKREAARSQRLFEEGVVSKEENDKMQNSLEQAEEDLAAANYQVDVITTGFSKRSATVNTTEVRSTMTGLVLEVPVKVGSSVSGSSQFSAGTTIATVGDMSDFVFTGNVDEVDIAKLQLGMKVTVTPGSMSDVRISAELEYIAPSSKDQNGAKVFEIKAKTDIPDDIVIRSGYSANASITLDKVDDVFSVDESCVALEGDKTFVYKLTSNPKDSLKQRFEKVPVEIGLSDGVYIEIKKGVSSNMKLRGLKK